MATHNNANGLTYADIDRLLELANTSVQGDDSRLSDARPPTSHDHSSNKLTQANTHQSPDTDTATTSLHHTLGTGANQAAPGDTTARAVTMAKILFGGAL